MACQENQPGSIVTASRETLRAGKVSPGYWIMGVLVMVVMNVRVFVSLGFGAVPMIN